MKIKLKSSYPCLVKIGNNSYDIDENDLLEIENEEQIFVYPISYNRKNIPFYINLNALKNCERYLVTDIDDYKLLFLNKVDRISNFAKEKLTFSEDNCEIKISNNVVIFENKNSIVQYELEEMFLNYRVFKIEDFACVELDAKSVFAFNMKTGKLFHFKGNEFEFEKDLLKIKDNLNDCEDRRKSCVYKFSGDNIATEKCEFDYSDLHFKAEMTPYRFLEAVKCKDYSFAKNLLGGNLKNVEEKDFYEFLGSIKAFYPLSLNEFIIENSSEKKLIRFDVSNGLIFDLSVDNL